MYCSKCGELIDENSLFCKYCGSETSKELNGTIIPTENIESKIKDFINQNKSFVLFYLIWFMLHLVLLMVGRGDSPFWPFETCFTCTNVDTFDDYGFSEFVVYLIFPIVFFGIWKITGKDIKKAFSED